MKTLNHKKTYQKLLSSFLTVSLCLSQAIPAGNASVESVEQVGNRSVSVLTLDEMVAQENNTSKDSLEMVSKHDVFLNPSPLSVVVSEDETKQSLESPVNSKLTSKILVAPLQEGWNPVAFNDGEEDKVEQILGTRPTTKERLWSVSKTDWWGESTTFRYLDSEGNLIGTKRVVKAFPVPSAGFEGTEEIFWYDANGNSVDGEDSLANNVNRVASLAQDAEPQSYEDKLAQLDEILSGIARDGADEESVLAAHDILVELREAIQSIIDNGEQSSEDILDEFHNRIDRLDEILSREPIRMEIDGEIVEVNLSEVMRVIAEEYRRLTGEEGIDYNRLPGVDAEDLEGHQTFAEALAFRQVGVTTTISVFEALSAYGNFTFVSDLLKKYGDQVIGEDRDLDGVPEVDLQRFRRLVNGTEEAYQEGLAIIEEILAENPVDYPEVDIVSFEDISQLAEFISAIHTDMKDRIQALIDNLDFEQPFIDLIQTELNHLIRENYQPLVTEFVDFLKSHETEVVTIVEDHNIQIPTDSIVNAEDIRTYIDQLDALHADLSLRFQDLAESLSDIEASLMNQIRTILQCDANGCFEYDHATQRSNKVVGAYQSIHTGIYNLFWQRDIRFNIDGIGEVIVSLEQLRLLTNGLPNSIEGLMKFPGIAEQITEEMLDALEKRHTQIDRAQVFLEPYSSTPVPDTISNYGMRIELMALLLETYGDEVIQNNQVDTDLFRRAILMDDVLEDLFDSVQALILGAQGRVDEIVGDLSQGITSDVYQQLMGLIEDTNNAAVATMKLALDSVIYEARALITSMIQDDFNDLLNKVDRVLNQAKIQVTIDGATHLVEGKEVLSIMREILPSLAINVSSRDYTRDQYGRLNGVPEHILNTLKTQYEFDWNRQIRFSEYSPTFSRDGHQQIAGQELLFRLIPEILKNLGSGIVDSEGNISLTAVGEELVKDVYLPVPVGESILEHFKDALNEILPEGLKRLQALDFSKWEERKQAEAIMQDVLRQLAESASPLIQNLNDSEKQLLESRANYGVYRDSTWKLTQLTDFLRNQLNQHQVVTVTMSDGSTVEINLRDVRNIPGFPRSIQFDRELFVGVQDSDLIDTGKQVYYQLRLRNTTQTEVPSHLDAESLIVNIVTRLYENQEDIADIYRDRMFVDGKLNHEIFRRYLKGVDVLHREILETIQSWTDEEVEAIEALKTVPMTIDSIKAVYDAVMAHRTRIMEYLTELTNRHEKEDVIEIEEDVTNIYQTVVDQLISYLRENDLTLEIPSPTSTGETIHVAVPVQEITQRLLAYLEEKFPGEENGAHHFASFFGVNMEDLRRYNKLEEFLGMQIIALPRNSQFVEIVSKLSEIGMMELITDVMEKYAAELVIEGVVDIDAFMEILTDPERAIERAKQKLDEVRDAAIDELDAIEFPLTNETFEKVMEIIRQAKLGLVNTGNDHVTGFEQEMFDEIQDYVSALYEELKTIRDEMILRGPIQITAADGTVFEIDLSELEDAALERILELIEVYNTGEIERPQPLPIYHYLDNIVPMKTRSMDMVAQKIAPIDGDYRRIYPPIWYPFPIKYDPNDTPTEAGFLTLLVRLAEKYGAFVVDENGDFSIDMFLDELDRTDLERAEERFQQMQEEALEELRSMVSSSESDPIDLEDILSIHEFLDVKREKFLKVLNALKGSGYGNYQIINVANAAWRAVMNEYESLLFNRDVNIEIDGQVYQVNAKELVDIIQEEYRAGHKDVVDEYKEGGETYWQYSNYKVLFQQIYYRPYPWYGKGYGVFEKEAVEESLPEGPYDFNLGQLNNIPGINTQDLAQLDVVSKDMVTLTFNADLREMLKGRLNMRVFAPGANVQTVGASDSASMMMESSVVSKDGMNMFRSIRIAPWLDLSQRDLLFRVVPAMLRDNIDKLTNQNNEIDLDRFRDFLRGVNHDLPPEEANALEAFDTDGDKEISGEEAIEGLKDFRDAFNSLDGDENYDVKHDYNGDGVIDFGDFGTLVNLFEVTGPRDILKAFTTFDANGDFTISGEEAIEGLRDFRDAFNSRDGEANYDSRHDYNEDGAIDFSDFTVLTDLFGITGPTEILKAFTVFDTNGDFTISGEEAINGLKAFRDAFNTLEGDDGYEVMHDYNSNGEIAFDDFSTLVDLFAVTGPQELLKAFVTFDTDGDFTITFQEAIAGMSGFVAVFNTIEGDADYDTQFDFNGDGSIDFGDFIVITELFEVTGPFQLLSVFTAVDESHDFLISRDEAMAGIQDFRAAFNSLEGDENYDALYDFNQDGLIDELDYEDFLVPVYDVMGHSDLLPDVQELLGDQEIREVLYEASFGDGYLEIVRITDVSTGEERIEASIVVDGQVLKRFDVSEYNIRGTYENSSYVRYRVKLTTVLDEVVYFTAYEYKNSSRSPRVYYTVYDRSTSETYGDLIKRMTFKLIGNELLQTAETIYRVESRLLSNGRTRDVKRVLQHTYWSYDSEGNLKYENITRRTPDGARLSIRKTPQNDGSVTHRIRLRGVNTENVTIDGEPVNLSNYYTSRPVHLQKSSDGLLEGVTIPHSNGTGAIEISINLETISVIYRVISGLLEPMLSARVHELDRSALEIIAPHPLQLTLGSQSEVETVGG